MATTGFKNVSALRAQAFCYENKGIYPTYKAFFGQCSPKITADFNALSTWRRAETWRYFQAWTQQFEAEIYQRGATAICDCQVVLAILRDVELLVRIDIQGHCFTN